MNRFIKLLDASKVILSDVRSRHPEIAVYKSGAYLVSGEMLQALSDAAEACEVRS